MGANLTDDRCLFCYIIGLLIKPNSTLRELGEAITGNTAMNQLMAS